MQLTRGLSILPNTCALRGYAGVKCSKDVDWHHWKAIVPKCKDDKELRKMADIVLSWSDDYGGKLIPVSVLRNKLKGEDGTAPWEKWIKTARNAAKKLAKDDATPQFIRSAAKGFLSRTVHPPLP